MRREQTTAVFLVDGMQPLQLRVGRLGLDPWDAPCVEERCRWPARSPCSRAPVLGAALGGALGEHGCWQWLWAGWLCWVSSPSPEPCRAPPARWAKPGLAGDWELGLGAGSCAVPSLAVPCLPPALAPRWLLHWPSQG